MDKETRTDPRGYVWEVRYDDFEAVTEYVFRFDDNFYMVIGPSIHDTDGNFPRHWRMSGTIQRDLESNSFSGASKEAMDYVKKLLCMLDEVQKGEHQ